MPAGASVDEIKRGREALDNLAQKTGRDPASIQILAFGRAGQFRDREIIKDLEQAGAKRVTIWLEYSEGPQALQELEDVARTVLI